MSDDEQVVIIVEPAARPARKRTYSVKFISKEKKSKFTVHNFRDVDEFDSILSMRSFIRSKFELQGDDFNMGYIEPAGHGWKGKYLWLNSDEDLEELYELCGKLKTILVWCQPTDDTTEKKLPAKSKRKKSGRRSSSQAQEPQTKRAKCVASNNAKANEAEDVFKALKEKHGTSGRSVNYRQLPQ